MFFGIGCEGTLGMPKWTPLGRLGGPNGSLQMLKLMILEVSRRVFGVYWPRSMWLLNMDMNPCLYVSFFAWFPVQSSD